ncbi:HAD family hydrolase [Verrucomicrobiota bacterium]
MKQIKHIIWDWNGTLYDDIPACVETLNAIMKKRNMSPIDIQRYKKLFEFPVRKYYEKLGFDFAKEDWDDMAHEFMDIYLEKSRGCSLRRNIFTVLESLQKRGIPMSVLSALEESLLNKILAEKGIIQFFENIKGLSNIYAESKLDAGRELIPRLSVQPEQIIMIGDTDHDFDIAQELGCQCLLLAGGHQADERIEQCGCQVVYDITTIENRL